MVYVSLYRKYRPQSFADVVGQRHVTETLANAISEDRLHHAYLFTGPRGTGKTSTARILAKALNCESGPTPEPCQTCANCVAITDGSAVDVVELDMASHGGVEDARDLRERAAFAPARTRRKVYILDEVHMASSAAFNALLKLIEEPPGHVLFAMATTEPQKVLPTIMSRVQRLDLRRVGQADVAALVVRIADQEGATLEETAVDAIVRAGDGSVRDTLSILEQVLAFAGRDITADHVAQLLGHTPTERVFDAVTYLAAGDLRGLFTLVQGLLDEGHDLRRFALDLAAHLRDLLVLEIAPDRPDLVDASADHRARLTEQVGALAQAELVEAIDAIGAALVEMRRGPARLPLEMTLANLAGPAQSSRPPAALTTVEATTPTKDTAPAPATESPATSTPEESEDRGDDGADAPQEATESPADSDVADLTIEVVRSRWEQILEIVKRQSPRVQAICAPSTPGQLAGDVLVVDFPAGNRWHAEELGKTENAEILATAIEQVLGQGLNVRTRLGDAADEPSETAKVDEEAAEIRVTEAAPIEDEGEATTKAEAILRDELGAVPVDET